MDSETGNGGLAYRGKPLETNREIASALDEALARASADLDDDDKRRALEFMVGMAIGRLLRRPDDK